MKPQIVPFLIVVLVTVIVVAITVRSSSECERRHGVLVLDAAGAYVCLQAVSR